MHRSDIDGLRAIAVLSVVLFHLGVSERISGGFVGVDVFFVISGYLITGVVQGEVLAGRFSLAEFYHRRVRRIFPALFVVHVCCLLASAVLLFPAESEEVGRDVLSSLAFVSNIRFSRASGYFDQSSNTAPLLHTWSLSVEEQFYVFFPLLLWVLARVRPWWRFALLSALALPSFLLCEHMVGVDARRAFYLVHFRAWELLGGALLALNVLPRLRHRVLLELFGIVGLTLIVGSVFVIKNTTPFPGYWALPPCLGTLAILYSGQAAKPFTARLLATPPLRWIGLISYSLYLWHWPVIAFYNASHRALSHTVQLEMFAATLLVSVLSYRYVEQPFRRRPYRRGARSALLIAACGTALMALLSLGIPQAALRLRPTSELAKAALSYVGYHIAQRPGTCFLHGGFDDVALFTKDPCLHLASDRKNYLIIGDSHAAHFAPVIGTRRPELNVLQATASGCEAVRHGRGAKRCTGLFNYVFDEFLPAHHVDAIVLAGRWPLESLRPLQRTLVYLRPFADRIIVFGPMVDYDQPFPQLLAQSITASDPGLPARHLIKAARTADRAYAAALATGEIEYYSVYEATCPKDECRLWAAPGVPMQYDAHHLTEAGTNLVLDRFGPALFR